MPIVRRCLAVAVIAALIPLPLQAAEATPGPISEAVRRSAFMPASAAPLLSATGSASGSSSRRKGGLIGAAIGGVAAIGVTYWAAKKYGENEAGGFCGGCFAQWGAFTIPIGVLLGALVGSQVHPAARAGTPLTRPSATPSPRRTR